MEDRQPVRKRKKERMKRNEHNTIDKLSKREWILIAVAHWIISVARRRHRSAVENMQLLISIRWTLNQIHIHTHSLTNSQNYKVQTDPCIKLSSHSNYNTNIKIYMWPGLMSMVAISFDFHGRCWPIWLSMCSALRFISSWSTLYCSTLEFMFDIGWIWFNLFFTNNIIRFVQWFEILDSNSYQMTYIIGS